MKRVQLIKHEVIPDCGSFEIRFPDGRPSRYIYWDDLPSRRIRPGGKTDRAVAERVGKIFARAEQHALNIQAGRWWLTGRGSSTSRAPAQRSKAADAQGSHRPLANEIPKAEHGLKSVQAAAYCVIEAAENNGPMVFARMGVMKAVHRHHVEMVDINAQAAPLGQAEA
jgi:hypothetical protein